MPGDRGVVVDHRHASRSTIIGSRNRSHAISDHAVTTGISHVRHVTVVDAATCAGYAIIAQASGIDGGDAVELRSERVGVDVVAEREAGGGAHPLDRPPDGRDHQRRP